MFNTFSDKELIVELLAFYTADKLAQALNCTEQTISNLLRDKTKTLQSATSAQLRNFFEMHVKQYAKPKAITEVIKDSSANKKAIIVNSPDGFVPILKFFTKPNKKCFKLSTEKNSIKCSVDHLIETNFGWVLTSDLDDGDLILTKDGFEVLEHKVELEVQNTYDFEVGHDNHRYWGGTGISSHNSGKSYLCGNIIREAQKDGAFVLMLDSENAQDENFLGALGVDISADKFMYVGVVTIQDVTTVVSEFITNYEKDYGRDNPDAPMVVICLDSLDMLLTDAESEKFNKGEQTGDMGQRTKLIKHMLRTFVSRISRLNIAFIATHQVYANQDITNGQGKWIVNNAVRYSASQIALISKLNLKEGSDILGIRMRVDTYKSRFAKLGTRVEIEVPYTTGMDPYDGVLDDLVLEGIVKQGGAWYTLELPGEDPIKFQRKNFGKEIFDKILSMDKIKEHDDLVTSDLMIPEEPIPEDQSA
jgi:RecA/RadA recombinase